MLRLRFLVAAVFAGIAGAGAARYYDAWLVALVAVAAFAALAWVIRPLD